MLNPPIAAIRRGLFDPPDAAERDGVDVTAEAEVSSTQPVPEIPTWLLSQIDQIVASRAVLNADAVVAIGDIRQIATVRDGDGNHIRTLDWPVAILVTSYTTDGSTGTAQGFCVASESLYCGPQDVLLQEPDGPFDPSAVMVQLWNRMDACIDAKAPLLGRLPQSSVDELKLLAKLPKKAWPATTAVPGKFGLAIVTAPKGGEFEIVTGTPLGEADDVRWIYRSIYRQLASELAEHLKPHQESAGDSPGMSGTPLTLLGFQFVELL